MDSVAGALVLLAHNISECGGIVAAELPPIAENIQIGNVCGFRERLGHADAVYDPSHRRGLTERDLDIVFVVAGLQRVDFILAEDGVYAAMPVERQLEIKS